MFAVALRFRVFRLVEDGLWRVDVAGEPNSMVDNTDNSRLLDTSEAPKDCLEAIAG